MSIVRDLASHVRLLEEGLTEAPVRDRFAFIETLGHTVRLVPVRAGTAVVAQHVHGLAVTPSGVPVLMVTGPYERIDLSEE